MRLFFLILAAALLAAFAQPSGAGDRLFRSDTTELRFTDAPCNIASVLLHVPEADRAQFRRAHGKFLNLPYFVCYRETGPVVQPGWPPGTVIFLQWEDGDKGVLHSTELTDAPTL